jgi:ribosomal protein S18 acetylase RimI-like enzyme
VVSDDLRFGAVGPEHAEALVELFERNAIASVTEGFDPFALTSAKARWIAQQRRRDAYYLAISREQPVGMSMLRGFDDGYEIPSFGVFVDHLRHGEGIGRRLTVWTIDQARLRGCPAVRLSVYSDNPAARGLYASLGFIEQERRAADRRGAGVQKIVMRLDLG